MELPSYFHSARDKEKVHFIEQFQQELRDWLPCFKNIKIASQVRDKRIRHAIEYLMHQYQNKPTLTEVALHVGMSNGRLSFLIFRLSDVDGTCK
jgi:transcriptional regulator GlxA family with amidase domain